MIIRVTQETWQHFQELAKQHQYGGHGHLQSTACCIASLILANPHPINDWTDTRPHELRQHDAARILRLNKLPLWFYDNNVRFPEQHTFSAEHYERSVSTAIQIADHYGIRSQRQSTPTSVYAALLDAIGLKHLTPRNPPPNCLTPIKNAYRPGRRHSHPYELTF